MFTFFVLRRISAAMLRVAFLSGSISLVLISSTSLAQGAGDQTTPAVAYTGKTYGYLRNDANNYPEGILANDFVSTLCYIKARYPQSILVGMGDNFAPDYRARNYFDSASKRMEPVPRLRPTTGGKDGPELSPAVQFFKSFPLNTFPAADCQQLKQQSAGYDAIVPGQLDFYFGADFLWRVGNGADGNPASAQLPMLAANLVIQSTKQPVTPQPLCAQPQLILPTQVTLPLQSGSGSGGGKGKGGGGKKGGGGGGGGSSQGSSASSSGQGGGQSGQSGQLCLQERTADEPAGKTLTLVSPPADSVYPWVTEFEFSLPEGSQQPLQASLCPWKPQRSNVADCSPLEHLSPLKQSYSAEVSASDRVIQENGTLLSSDSKPLHSGADIEICVPPTDPKNLFVCTSKPIHVQRVFFDQVWKTVERNLAAGSVNYAVFAAIDPAIRALISPENSSWGKDNEYTAQIGILDPAPALTQLMTAFQSYHSDKQWTYVLLAQMQRAQAQALAASLRWQQEHPPKDRPAEKKRDYRFQVIISAADYDEATPELGLTLHADAGPGAGLRRPPTPVITPYPIVTEKRVRNPLGVVEAQDLPDGITTTYSNHTYPGSDQCARYDDILSTLNTAALQKLIDFLWDGTDQSTRDKKIRADPDKKNCNSESAFQCLTLKTMRDQLEADAAVLQSRDFYSECNYEGPTGAANPSWNELVQRVLWNSGYLTRASVSGTTLKAILQASENISKLEQSSTNEPIIRGRDLVSIGITKSSGLYYINGAALEDSKIYSIATSDQLALGDPAYPQFAQPDLVVPTVFTEYYKKTFAIAELAASPFVYPTSNHRQLRGSNISLTRDKIVAPLPTTVTVPNPTSPPTPNGAPPAPFTPKDNPVVAAFQNRHVLSITLQQASAGYTDSRPNQGDASIATNLSGVNNPNVLSPHSDSLSFSDSLRLLWQYNAHWNFGFDQILQFNRARQGALSVPTGPPPITTTGAPVPLETTNLSANSLIVSPFFELQSHRWQRHGKLVVRPMTFSSGIATFDQFLATGIKSNPGQPTVQYELRLKHQENWQPSVGGRYEWSNLNFFEAGWLYQSARNIPSSLIINGTPVLLTAGTTISQAAMNNILALGDTAVVGYKTYQQQGGYWLGMLTKNLTGNAKAVKLTYQGYTFGNFFAYGPFLTTSTALTRYAAELSNNLQLQLWGNISFGPAYNIFWFQDQSHKPGNSLTRRDWNLQLNYSFDWHQGLEWKDVLEGKTQ